MLSSFACRPLGLFIGLSTLDIIYLASGPPQANQKLVALDSLISAGGPATNAAATFAHLGNSAHLLSAMGQHPITQLMRSDLASVSPSILHTDLTPTQTQSPPVSSIVVTQTTGERAVISLNAQRQIAQPDQIPQDLRKKLTTTDIILMDGHQIPVSLAIAQQATNIPTVLDGGSWKPSLENLLPYINYAICSTDFHPPGCEDTQATVEYLKQTLPDPAHIAITQGDQPILYWDDTEGGSVPLPQITPVDTLGAGDIFHGAFCHFILGSDFPQALAQAAHVASTACQFFGTRAWMQSY
ncbi:PfkB family carbohydrate kinase [Acaryochloris marina]|uniref:Kinase, PfkB family n=1 Tax=Acaryochloris marina (strain MBIC 11017) TaxID=329726 RepID=B0C9Q0_ACAM1|nr:PfkB family carbohydrate kinase [Acaryochloris marina]ABW30198.1 kinase, PfkB family [Acaryochloris marina MBIC11017]